MTITETPPQKGLTRTPTEYPSSVFPGWYLSGNEVKRQEKRARERWAERTQEVGSLLPTRTCRTCGKAYTDPRNHRKADCEDCRKAAQRRWNSGVGSKAS